MTMHFVGATARAGSILGRIVLLLLWLAGEGKAWGEQPLVLPPLQADVQIVDALLETQEEDTRPQVGVLYQIAARTNVIPLDWSSRRPLPDVQFSDRQAYYRTVSSLQVAVSLGRYRVRYTRGVTQNYTGSPGAAQLYLDSQGRGIRYFRQYDADVYMNNSEVTSWTLEQSVPLHAARGEGSLQLGVSLLETHRVQQGNLRGAMRFWQFEGDLALDTTRGLPAEDARGWGAAAHVALKWRFSHAVRAGVWAENVLSAIWGQRFQEIRAKVRTNTVIPDADGFLRAAPFLSGTIQKGKRRLTVQPRYTLGMALLQRRAGIVLLVQKDTDWRYQMVYARGSSRLLWSPSPAHYAYEWRTGAWRWQVGTSHAQPQRATRAFFTIQWSSPLGR